MITKTFPKLHTMTAGATTYSLRFPRGATHLMVGPSASGKTFRTAQILRLKNAIIEGGRDVKNVIFCYAAWQPIYQALKEDGVVTKWINKMPTNDEFISLTESYRNRGGSICVIDDFMSGINKDLDEIVRVTSRHMNTSTFILFQSLFPPHKLARQISLNVKFLHVHKNPRENAQIQYLARQIMPQNSKWIVQSYHEATKHPFSCFLIDLTQQRESHLRFRSNYLPNEFPMRVWHSRGSLL